LSERRDVVVETATSPSSVLALSRFEFETGKGNEGTKVLMVEWDPSAAWRPPQTADAERCAQGPPAGADGARDHWHVSWEGKSTVSVRGVDPVLGDSLHREYFLLPVGSQIPALVTISYRNGVSEALALQTKPMPAIFPAELGPGEDVGRRGILHTIWARKRLAELQAEITAEMKANGEGVGLEMAMQERQWIVDHFGLSRGQDVPWPTKSHIPQAPVGPGNPRNPVGGRLGEKLRGLKLATSTTELAATRVSSGVKSTVASEHALSQVASGHRARAEAGGMGHGSLASLNVIVGSNLPSTSREGGDLTTEDELFALPMSPRSPEMKRSPFSRLG